MHSFFFLLLLTHIDTPFVPKRLDYILYTLATCNANSNTNHYSNHVVVAVPKPLLANVAFFLFSISYS